MNHNGVNIFIFNERPFKLILGTRYFAQNVFNTKGNNFRGVQQKFRKKIFFGHPYSTYMFLYI